MIIKLVAVLSPVKHKRLHRGWTQTSVYLQVIHSTSLSFLLSPSNHSSNSIHDFGTQNQKNNKICFWAYLHSTSTQHGNLHPAGWPILFCWPTQEAVLATGKTREKFGKNAGEWTGRVEISEEEIPGSKRSLYGYILTNFNFCVRSSPPREYE